MTKREVVGMALDFKRPPYVSWSFRFTREATDKLVGHYGAVDLEPFIQSHFLELGRDIGLFEEMGCDRVRDVFGVVWNRTIDKDIGNVEGQVLPEATLKGYQFPDPLDARFFEDIPERLGRYWDRFRVFCIGFSLFERAWTLRGMEQLYMDFVDSPEFVHELLNTIADYNIAQLRHAATYDIDAVYFGDDWGQQHGLLMGYPTWREFIYPVLRRMYRAVLDEGKMVIIHSCGDVDDLFDDLVGIGLRCFNPFQPEVMDVVDLMQRYRGRLAFWGGLSMQRTLPFGTVQDVDAETRRLLALGRAGGYILSPSHAVEGYVPLENMLAFIDMVQQQAGFEPTPH
jgi:uroporphyrinogen decarboxylase